jgi:sugar phosphate isomerase/epimerase
MRTCCSSWSHHRVIAAGQMDQLAWLRECADLGLDGVELLGRHFPNTDHEYLITVKKACVDMYLNIAMVSAGGNLTTSDDALRQQEVQDICRWVDIAAFLGAPLVRFFCGKGQELTDGGPALFAKVQAAMLQICQYGQKHGIVMALENHGGTTADQVLSLQHDVNHPFLKFTLDTGNFPPTSQVGPETYTSIARCATQAAIVHAKFFDVNADGTDGRFDWTKIHQALKQAGFRGFLSIEYEGKDGDEVAVVRRVAKYLSTLR